MAVAAASAPIEADEEEEDMVVATRGWLAGWQVADLILVGFGLVAGLVGATALLYRRRVERNMCGGRVARCLDSTHQPTPTLF